MARVIHAVLACRVILHIREQAHVRRHGNLNQESSDASADLLVSGEDIVYHSLDSSFQSVS